MKLNVDKTSFVSFAKTRKHQTVYSLCGSPLVQRSTCKYLGVTLTSNLNWNLHISQTCSKALKNLYFVMRNLGGASRQTKAHAYLCLIRPILEYCCGVWDPRKKGQLILLDNVQRKAARFTANEHRRWNKTANCPHLSVSQIIAELQWEPLSVRRSNATLRCLFKVLTKSDAWVDICALTSRANFHGRHDHPWKIQLPRHNTDIGRDSFLGRAIRTWNQLSVEDINVLGDVQSLEFNP